jgi:hypothetical protein
MTSAVMAKATAPAVGAGSPRGRSAPQRAFTRQPRQPRAMRTTPAAPDRYVGEK